MIMMVMSASMIVTFGVLAMAMTMAMVISMVSMIDVSMMDVSSVVAGRAFNRSTVFIGFKVTAFEELVDYQYATGTQSFF
jgi:hypothetical protein